MNNNDESNDDDDDDNDDGDQDDDDDQGDNDKNNVQSNDQLIDDDGTWLSSKKNPKNRIRNTTHYLRKFTRWLRKDYNAKCRYSDFASQLRNGITSRHLVTPLLQYAFAESSGDFFSTIIIHLGLLYIQTQFGHNRDVDELL